jgi:hypothetical protein
MKEHSAGTGLGENDGASVILPVVSFEELIETFALTRNNCTHCRECVAEIDY